MKRRKKNVITNFKTFRILHVGTRNQNRTDSVHIGAEPCWTDVIGPHGGDINVRRAHILYDTHTHT